MFRRRGTPSSRHGSVGQKETLRFLAPENASLAQGLLQIILDNAQIEIFSPSGGGVAVMLLQRWQIEMLTDFGVCLEERMVTPPSFQQDELQAFHGSNPEYLTILDEPAGPPHRRLGQPLQVNVDDDILSDWLEVETTPDVRRSAQ